MSVTPASASLEATGPQDPASSLKMIWTRACAMPMQKNLEELIRRAYACFAAAGSAAGAAVGAAGAAAAS